MKNWLTIFVAIAALVIGAVAQTKRTVRKTGVKSTTAAKPAVQTPARPAGYKGVVSGRTYTNKAFGFEITFPDTWLIPDDDFEAYMKKNGFDISLKPPKAANAQDQKTLNASFNRLTILLTAYRSLPGTPANAVARVSVENIRTLNTTRPVKDAVDYVDLMRSSFKLVQMPADYKYSETQAEKLGENEFAYIDSSNKDQKTRLYATVRNGYALLFSLNYSADEDLETFRDVLARAKFSSK